MSPEPRAPIPLRDFSRPAAPGLSWLQRAFGVALAGAAGLVIMSLLFVFSLVAFVTGYGTVGTVLLALLLLAALGTAYFGVQTARRSLKTGQQQLQRVQQRVGDAQEQVQQQSARRELVRLWTRYGTRLPPQVRPALRGAITATDEALKAVEGELGRERYEAQQAATRDLPELLDLYSRVGNDSAELAELERSLALIEQRMRQIAAYITAEQQREFAVRREYLNDKYAEDLLDPDRPRP